MTIDTTNMCSHLQRKLFEKDGIYHSLWMVMQDDSELTAVVRSRQLHIYRNGKKVLVFYVMGHMFSFFDCNDFSVISLKCQPERIEELKAQHDCIGNPYNESPKHWIGINPKNAPDDLLQELTRNSFDIVKAKYASKRGQKQTRLDSAEREHTRPKVKYTKI